MAEAASESFSERLDTEVTSMSISCSTLNFFSAVGDVIVSACTAARGKSTKPANKTAAQRGGNNLDPPMPLVADALCIAVINNARLPCRRHCARFLREWCLGNHIPDGDRARDFDR